MDPSIEGEFYKQCVALAFTNGTRFAGYLWERLKTRRQGKLADPEALVGAVRRLIEAHPEEEQRLRDLIDEALGKNRQRPRIVVDGPMLVDRVGAWRQLNGRTGTLIMSGLSGIGKTKLATQYAQRAEPADGALYVDLAQFRDGPGMPIRHSRIRAHVLGRLGVSPDLVARTDETLVTQYETFFTDLRCVVVFDSVEAADDLRGLIPQAPMSLFLGLTEHYGDDYIQQYPQHVPLGRLEEGTDRQLLQQLCHDVVPPDPAAVERLLACCDRIPGAVVVAAMRVRSRAAFAPDPYALVADELATGGTLGPISQGFDRAFAELSEPAAELCRRLSVSPAPSLPLEAVLALSGKQQVSDISEALAELQSVGFVTAEGRIGLGHQPRQAVARAGGHPAWRDVLGRLVRFYAGLAIDADQKKMRDDRLRLFDRSRPEGVAEARFDGDPLNRLMPEIPVYRALIGPAQDAGFDVEVTQICGALEIVGLHKGAHRELAEITAVGIRSAQELKNDALLARLHSQLGRLLCFTHDFFGAQREFEHAEAALKTDVPRLRASMLEFRGLFHRDQALILRDQGRSDDAVKHFEASISCYENALKICRTFPDKGNRARGLNARMLANVLVLAGKSDRVAEVLAEAEAFTDEEKSRDLAQVWLVRAKWLSRTNQAEEALALLPEVWRLAAGAGSDQYDLEIAEELGDAAWYAGDRDLARQYWSGVYQRFAEARHPAANRLYGKIAAGLS